MTEPSVRCGCGLEITGLAEDATVEVYSAHYCTNQPPRVVTEAKWYRSIFQPMNIFFVCVAAVVIVEILFGPIHTAL